MLKNFELAVCMRLSEQDKRQMPSSKKYGKYRENKITIPTKKSKEECFTER
ncbi:MAG: hypothetical protein N3G80_00865 [Candidatus Micrarchaeota archaeon]|nr:hypothetical protein [Candidatus Micrarchaeota archaeon]